MPQYVHSLCYSAPMHLSQRPGFGALGLLLFFIILLFLIFAGDMLYIAGSKNCIDRDLFDCALDILAPDKDEGAQPQEGSVTATGVISGNYGKSERSVSVTLTFPLEGGAVTGTFSGDCDGNIKGTFAGGNGGTISGTGKGSCGFILPASGSFSGTVNTASKAVNVSGQGSAAGFSGQGSLTLRY